MIPFFLNVLKPILDLLIGLVDSIDKYLNGHDIAHVLPMFVLATMDTPDEVAVLDTLGVGADVLQCCFFMAGLKTREPAIVHRLNIMSSNPYYAKEKCQDDQWGFNFQAREGELARELQKMKLQNEKKQREIDSMLASDKEIQEVRRKIEASYLSK